jgi:hypothetical protein
MHKRAVILSDVHKGFKWKKKFQAFAASSCMDEIEPNICLTNGGILQFNHVSFFDFASAIFSIPCSTNHVQTKSILRCQIHKKTPGAHCTMQNIAFAK